MRKTIIERFEEKHVPEPNPGCWLWKAHINTGGYGVFGHKGGPKTAHRVSYELHIGEIPDGLCVLHHCDIPNCVNPDHLFLGTQADNMADMYAKGRRPRPVGEAHPGAVLNNAKVINIRTSNKTIKELADKYGVRLGTIYNVLSRVSWDHVK